MKISLRINILLLYFLVTSYTLASTVNIRILDQTGAGFPEVLVVLKSLQSKGELFRELTNDQGYIEKHEIPTGLYRIILICPYGICQTKIKDFHIGKKCLNLNIKVDADWNRYDPLIYQRYICVHVLDIDKNPIANVKILARNINATYECWYKTDEGGNAKIGVIDNPFVIILINEEHVFEKNVNIKELAHSKFLSTDSKNATYYNMDIVIPTK